jgi:hypothetical protein
MRSQVDLVYRDENGIDHIYYAARRDELRGEWAELLAEWEPADEQQDNADTARANGRELPEGRDEAKRRARPAASSNRDRQADALAWDQISTSAVQLEPPAAQVYSSSLDARRRGQNDAQWLTAGELAPPVDTTDCPEHPGDAPDNAVS